MPMPQRSHSLKTQFTKYVFVGLISNLAAYCFYLILSQAGLAPISSMSITYAAACCISFYYNKTWTFDSNTKTRLQLPKYVLAQAIGFFTNLAILFCLHYSLGIPHQIAQLLGIATVAVELFVINRFYVFT